MISSRRVLLLLCLVMMAGSHGWAVTDPDHEAWRSGREALTRKDWPHAAAMFALYRDTYPDDVAGWVMEGWTRRQMKEHTEADRLFQQALEIEPDQADALYHFAHRYWSKRELERAFEMLSRIKTVPSNLEADVNHLAGVLKVMLDIKPEEAVRHLRAVQNPDGPTRVLLVLALLRLHREPEALREGEKLCPADERESAPQAWVRCLDRDYCGELLEQRLEILRLLVGTRSDDTDLVANAARVHLRHREPPGKLTDLLQAASRDEPGICHLALLHGLSAEMGGGESRSEACAAYERAASCLASGGDTSKLRLTGPLFDPSTGALLDLGRSRRVVEELMASRCRQLTGG